MESIVIIMANVPVQMVMLLVTSAIVVPRDFMDFQIVLKVDNCVKLLSKIYVLKLKTGWSKKKSYVGKFAVDIFLKWRFHCNTYV